MLALGVQPDSNAQNRAVNEFRAPVFKRGAAACFCRVKRNAWAVYLLLLLLWVRPGAALLLLETETLWDGAAPELALVTVMLNGKDLRADALVAFTSAADSTEGAVVYVDLAEFAQALDLELREEDQRLMLVTPIGVADFPSQLIRPLDQRRMIALDVLGQRIASSVNFNASEYALMVDVPWPLGGVPDDVEIIRPSGQAGASIDAPVASLSFIRTEFLQRIERGSDTSSVISDLGGSLFNGYWQFRVRDYIERDPFIEDYVWLQTGRQHRFLLGNQNVGLDALLPGFEFTGAQAAWTNREIATFTRNVHDQQLIADQRGAIRSFVGQGPPGGRAELRIEGQVVSSTIIALDGRYEFRDVELPAGSTVQVEAWVFERGNEGVPANIESFSGYNTNRVLPASTLLVLGGYGVDGNLIEDARGQLDGAGFVSARYAPIDQLTLESSYQRVKGRDAGLTGISTNLGQFGFISANLAYADGLQAWRVEAENQQQHLFWRGFAQHQPDQWFEREGELDDVFAEVGYRFNREWRVSLVGRDFRDDQRDFDYLLPAFDWRPRENLLLSARPDFDGDYTAQSYWQINRKNSLNALYNENESSVQWLHNVNNSDSLSLQALDREDLGQRVAAIYRRNSGGLRHLGWALGVLAGEGQAGYLAQADYEFIPGLRARGEVFRDPYSGVNGRADTVASLSVVANFSLAGGRLTRGHFRRQLLDSGSLNGAIAVPESFGGRFDLSGVAIMVNGQERARSEDGGRFSIPYLAPGIYRIRMDLDGLPLELQPIQSTFWVEVAAGAASFVSFETEVLLGFAGQVTTEAGCPVGRAALVVRSDQGEVVRQLKTSDFGFYRVDGLHPGRYRLSLASDPEQAIDVLIDQDFLFKQDLTSGQEIQCP